MSSSSDPRQNPAGARLETPPRSQRADGQARQVGVEVEFAGLDCAPVAALIAERFGGAVGRTDAYCYRVEGSSLGDFEVELDMSAAHGAGEALSAAEEDGEAPLDKEVEWHLRSAVGAVGGLLLPTEITCPPLAWDRLPELDGLIESLRRAGALGTREHPVNAFGLQLNPELAEEGAGYLLDHLKAYLLLEDWLRETVGVDTTRRLTAFADPFPEHYVRKVVDPDYRPDLGTLIDDYLAANPTRNRSLDLLPAFAHLAPERVRRGIDDDRIKPRPTFHYRLPDSRVDEPGWGVVADWNRWLEVERLAADRERLDAEGRRWRERAGRGLAGALGERLERWLS